MKYHSGDYLVLGVGGKMGTTLALMLRQALDAAQRSARVIGVSRFSRPEVRAALEAEGIVTHACDLADPVQVAQLPPAANIFFLAGQKFGTSDAPEATWLQNTIVPGIVARHCTAARTVVFSTGCVYPFAAVDGPGCDESTPLACQGEYASSCVGRERVFTYYAQQHATPVSFFRLNYACELRYGVLVDIAKRVRSGDPIDLTTGWVNLIWQTDAVAVAIRSLELAATPPVPLNVTSKDKFAVRDIAAAFGRIFQREPVFVGTPAPTAWLSDAHACTSRYGAPAHDLDWMIAAVADYVQRDGSTLNKPTHFETRDGNF
ncbi:NAD-dependent epimerase/dehydratase family protein [Synoicihabitans lomoniglobus]|uniref:NAD-dependent epimerase/dehydratase family protein n=1 Tax=Synoicihabitans lomoniglobus TaxID=2909285 RepID=UPI002ED53D27|nr:NAD-dependent epimerase/dehydratase family protein [Opitutaceae bacterium LMO-M01]